MAAGPIPILFVAQIALGLLFSLRLWILWILRSRTPASAVSADRERLLGLAVIAFTLGLAADFYFMLDHGARSLSQIEPFVSFSLACAGIALALLGEGRGRIATAVACCGLALAWLPFILVP